MPHQKAGWSFFLKSPTTLNDESTGKMAEKIVYWLKQVNIASKKIASDQRGVVIGQVWSLDKGTQIMQLAYSRHHLLTF